MKNILKSLFVIIGILILASSCRIINPSVMLRTNKSYPYSTPSDTIPENYIIQKGDRIFFRLFSNEGFKIIDLTSAGDNAGRNLTGNQNAFAYLIESDSSINLPILGRIQLAGMDLREAEEFLEDKFSNYYNDPYITLQVENRRVIIFPGSGGDAKVIPIINEYTTIIEALALAGGITDLGKAHKVKVIRGNLNNPEIFNLDLSTAEGFAKAKLYYIRSNDIIYVEPSYRPFAAALTATSQVLGLLSSILLSIILINNLNAL